MKNVNIIMPLITVLGVVATCWLAIGRDTAAAKAYSQGWKDGSKSTSEYISEVPVKAQSKEDLILIMQLDSAKYTK